MPRILGHHKTLHTILLGATSTFQEPYKEPIAFFPTNTVVLWKKWVHSLRVKGLDATCHSFHEKTKLTSLHAIGYATKIIQNNQTRYDIKCNPQNI
jgi:hypothetical protein